MNGIARYFMLLALLWIVIGMTWGIQMAAMNDHTLAPAHAHLNLVGWVTFAIFAFYYHLVPGAAQGRLAKLHLAVAVAGVVLMIPGIAMAVTRQGEALAKIGSLLTLISTLIFAAAVLRGPGKPALRGAA
ncbi:hypothetical protein [Antarcticimicrobium luteum]|uniref:Uncharacterized protein n=1 Tax=Antarcticimicrobium luteum TaxID=2547397 RepID=A0A4R5VEC1_9RHOB|nr:hypothetical protein [Antarcticimicrobium luteum]TDK50066.1 hypothetical protein E1832_07840 [Antarcticimicrobium luteum]